jgi:hypothetical protein
LSKKDEIEVFDSQTWEGQRVSKAGGEQAVYGKAIKSPDILGGSRSHCLVSQAITSKLVNSQQIHPGEVTMMHSNQ